jgi:hypothetical protein
MSKIKCQVTVFFEEPFWIGVYERIAENKLEVCKVTFGAEPKDYEVYEFFMKNWKTLCFSPSVIGESRQESKINHKRMQRLIKKRISSHGIGTKSQNALKLQQEEGKLARKKASRAQKEEEQQRQFEIRQNKHKNKHRGH